MGSLAISIDIDSTLANTSQRHGAIPTDPDEFAKYNWRDYAMLCANDEPVKSVVTLMNLFKSQGFKVLLVSARHQDARELTKEWLDKHDIPWDYLFMENRYMWENHSQYKVRKLKEVLGLGFDVRLHVDDTALVRVAVEKELNIPVLVVDPCYNLVDDYCSK